MIIPIKGRKEMGNWGEKTAISGVIDLPIIRRGPHLVLKIYQN